MSSSDTIPPLKIPLPINFALALSAQLRNYSADGIEDAVEAAMSDPCAAYVPRRRSRCWISMEPDGSSETQIQQNSRRIRITALRSHAEVRGSIPLGSTI
jgi:hypothetical protein